MSDKNDSEKQIHGYERMLERARELLGETRDDLKPKVQMALDDAAEKATELGELTREEAEKIGDYLKRDLHSAGEYLASEEAKDLSNWLRFDIELVEDRIIDALSLLADPTQVELAQLAEQAQLAAWRTGEITGPGTLTCVSCGETLHFHKTGRIPPCPKCKGTTFSRTFDKD